MSGLLSVEPADVLSQDIVEKEMADVVGLFLCGQHPKHHLAVAKQYNANANTCKKNKTEVLFISYKFVKGFLAITYLLLDFFN